MVTNLVKVAWEAQRLFHVSSTSLRAPPAQMVIERPSFLSSFCLGANPPHLLPLREVPRDHNPVDAGLVPFCL